MIKNNNSNIILRPDARGRINLGKLAEGISGYLLNVTQSGLINLQPLAEIPVIEPYFKDGSDTDIKLKNAIERSENNESINMEDTPFFEDIQNA